MKLCIVDFDGTLFRLGPEAPVGEDPVGWFSKSASLQPPFKPKSPGPEYWIQPVLKSLRSAIANPDCFVIVLTGRESWFENRIKELLGQQGLVVDEILCRPATDYPIDQFKQYCLGYYLDWYGREVTEVFIWDDRVDLLSQLLKLCKERGFKARGFQVVSTPCDFL